MYTLATINPFYSARLKRRAAAPRPQPKPQPVYARLPLAPVNASPVPHLTSLYHFHRAGDYGDRSYPGNCGGNLIKDLLRYFRSHSVFDPMTGSGTCRDVCNELGIYCYSSDLHQGHDACDASQFPRGCFQFAWIHRALLGVDKILPQSLVFAGKFFHQRGEFRKTPGSGKQDLFFRREMELNFIRIVVMHFKLPRA